MTAVAAPALTPTIRASGRRWRFAVGSVVAVIAVALLTAVLAGQSSSSGAFDPADAGPQGGRALAQVLAEQGVRVDLARRFAAALGADARTTLLVDDDENLLTAAQWKRILAATRHLVVIDPSVDSLAVVAPSVDLAGAVTAGAAAADCTLPAARRAGPMTLPTGTSGVRLVAGDTRLACYHRNGAAQVVEVARKAADTVVLASSAPFENGSIASGGNAAVALNLLGERAHLVWYTPSPLDVPRSGAPTLAELTPTWVTPFIVLLIAAGVAAAFWRGRRLGPLVVERMPVVVRSRETVEGRARLYRRGRALLRAADAIRMGTITRIAPLLGLSRTSPVEDVVLAAAALTGRPADAVRATLLTAVPTTEAELVALSDELARIEGAVRAAVPGAAALPAEAHARPARPNRGARP